MPVYELRDRRGRPRGEEALLDRDAILAGIDGLLDAAGETAGGALLLVGHAGMGKTRLHEAALDRARPRGLVVVRAAGAELEQNLAFGVAGQLLRSLMGELPAGERRALLAQAPERVKSLEQSEREQERESAPEELAVAHGLFTVLAGALERRPALMAIDDLHWSDTASLGFVLYLLHRLHDLPLAVLLTRRPGEGPPEAATMLDRIAAHPRVRVQSLAPLSLAAVRALVTRTLGRRSSGELARACLQATAGNPFYLHELLLALAGERGLRGVRLTERARALAPSAVIRSLRVRVARLGPEAGQLARAVAILGDEVPLRHAAALAGLEPARAARCADALASAEILLAREPLSYVHPLVRAAIEQDIPPGERSLRHLDAARLLYAEGAGAERLAAHLLLAAPRGSGWVVQRLLEAAREASSRAAAQSAVRYLQRALAEPPPLRLRASILGELGRAEAALGLPEAAAHLAAAAGSTSDAGERAELALARGRALSSQGRHREAAAAFEEGLRELGPQAAAGAELHDQLQTGFITSAWLVDDLHKEADQRTRRLLAGVPERPVTHGQRLLLAQAAVRASFAASRADRVVELAERAWDGGRLLETESSDGVGWTLVSSALALAGELERSLEVATAALEDARRRAAPLAFASCCYARALPQLWRGQVADALADLELLAEGQQLGWRRFPRAVAARLALCLLEAGQPHRAESALLAPGPLAPPHDMEDAMRLYALAELRRAQGRLREALELALACGEAAMRTVKHLGTSPWSTVAAQAALGLGERDRARRLAAEALDRAERVGVLHLRIRALRVLGACEGGEAGMARLRLAVELGEAAPPRLETVHALVDWGAALRRNNERAAAREPLLRAVDLAQRGGALALVERARVELAATGARPRRGALLSGPASLTPSERRIALLAAEGRSNREIAGTLFVTPKTVEYHLRNAYRKLGIATGRELARALGDS